MAKAKKNTERRAVVSVKKKTAQGNGQFSKLPNKKGSTKKKYRGQGK